MAAPPSTLRMSIHFVLLDPTTRRLRQSRRHGLLEIDNAKQVASVTYPKAGKSLYRRSFCQPRMAVIGRHVLRVLSSRDAFMCRFLDTRSDDREQCVEALRSMGVRIVDVRPEAFIVQEPDAGRRIDAEVLQAHAAELTAILKHQHPRHDAVVTELAAYSRSNQLQEDIATISDCFFLAP